MKGQHFAAPLHSTKLGDGPGIRPIYAKPYTCRVCDKPIEHRGAGAWRHTK